VRRLLLLTAVGLLAAAPPAVAADCGSMQVDLEAEVMCPTCEGQTLDQSTAPAAQRVEALIAAQCRGGATKDEIKDKLAAEFGPAILAAPPREGFGLLAWLLPLVGILVAGVAVGAAAWRWSRSREPEHDTEPGETSSNGRVTLDPELDRRLDEELARFD
jgi:cytochrome c-type biogenesis protein CcmH